MRILSLIPESLHEELFKEVEEVLSLKKATKVLNDKMDKLEGKNDKEDNEATKEEIAEVVKNMM
jgi:hypothetical protein